MRVDDEIDRLYGLPLDEFTAARNALAGDRRKAGEREAADAVKALPKPSLSAWVVNQLARRERMQVRSLLTAGERLRAAQEALLRGGEQEELRKASARQRDVVEALLAGAREILRSAGRPATEAVLERVRATLAAAAGDEEGRQLLERGRLVEDLDPTGFGPLATVAPGARAAGDTRTAARTKRLEKARREVDELRAEVDERKASARRAREEAKQAARAAAAAARAAEKEEKAVEALQGRLEAARKALERDR